MKILRYLLGFGVAIHFVAELQAAACDPILTFADGKSPTRQVFVSPNGHDTNGDGTVELPFQTIRRAAQEVQPGEAIRLLPGTYAGGTYLEGLSGTADAPIWLGGSSEASSAVFAGDHQALHLSRVRYLVLENMTISGSTQNGINIDDGAQYNNPDATRYLVFRNLTFQDIGTGGNQDALKLSGVDDFHILDCSFSRTSAGGSGIDHVGCHRGVIARCTFTDMGSNAIQCKGGSEDIEIRSNRFQNGGQRAVNIGGSTGFRFFRPPLSRDRPNAEARNIRVVANLFEGGNVPICFVGSVESVAGHNTIINPDRWIMRILQETTSRQGYSFLPCSQNVFVNNLVYFKASQIRSLVNIGAHTQPSSFTFSHNLWYAWDRDRTQVSQPDLPALPTDSIVGKDPEFINTAEGDFTVSSSSPAVGAGIAWPGVRADFRERCYANPPTVGALEANPIR